ncbi:MAG TPA: Crp/Fnr family transcriptional regulator [Chitinophagaceae bacterium]|nr:Crp/Fnr family transcriptional regulator [Chitinophagaceae bacterium]
MKNSKHNCDLKSCFLCTRCLPEWLPAIETHRQTIPVKKGTVIFEEGDPVEGIYFMYSGKVKVHKKWGPDKELIVRIAGKGAIVGHRGLGKSTIYPVSATALEPSTVCFIGLDFFESTLKVNHDFTYQLMLFFAEELQESEKNMRNLAHMTVKGRVAQLLLMLEEKFGIEKNGWIDISLSRQDLASLAGTTYETIFRVITEMVQEEMIVVDNKNITISNKEALLKLTDELA